MNSQGRTEGKNYQIKAVKAKLKKNIKFFIHFRLTSGRLVPRNVTFWKVSIGEIGYKLTESNRFFLAILDQIQSFGADVGGQRCPDSVRQYCAVSDGQNQVQIRNPDTRKPSRLKISDIAWQTPHYEQNPDSAVCRRLIWGHIRSFFYHKLFIRLGHIIKTWTKLKLVCLIYQHYENSL